MTTTNLDLLVIALVVAVAYGISISRVAPVIASFFATMASRRHLR